ncbi:MAG: hypothetical protein H0V80_17870, partial [Acidobacteria bacterium]|nr:hypothetical protein [Acidobacteriota bacterium]
MPPLRTESRLRIRGLTMLGLLSSVALHGAGSPEPASIAPQPVVTPITGTARPASVPLGFEAIDDTQFVACARGYVARIQPDTVTVTLPGALDVPQTISLALRGTRSGAQPWRAASSG